jgi:hypothetical protein
MITLGNVHDAAGDQIVFNNTTTEVLAGTAAVNVTSAGSSLAKALDLAAADAAASQSGGKIGADTGVFDWFQLGGNTYIVRRSIHQHFCGSYCSRRRGRSGDDRRHSQSQRWNTRWPYADPLAIERSIPARIDVHYTHFP